VGFYNDAAGNPHAYEYNRATKTFTAIVPPNGATGAMATGINDQNDVVGTEIKAGTPRGFVIINGKFNTLSISKKLTPPAVTLSAFGINDLLQVVGSCTDVAGLTHCFVDNNGTPVTINQLDSNGFTVVNGINNGGTLVGFYDTTAGDNCMTTCNGFVAVPSPF
jgi:uncharacterized membrane protein